MNKLKIPSRTRSSAIRAGYDIRIQGMFYEVVHIVSKEIVGRSEESAKDALNQAFQTRRTASIRPRGSSPTPNKISRLLRAYVTDYDTGKVDQALFIKVCEDNDIKHRRWKNLNGGIKIMILITTLRGILVGSRKRTPKPINIGSIQLKPGDDLS